MSMRYDVCVVGAGLIGTAAAKYLATEGSLSVCLIGPEEPKNKDFKRDIFGEHYDEGRITRKIALNSIWSKLAERSIDEYRNIEKESGVEFYREVGFLSVGRKGTVLDDEEATAQHRGFEYTKCRDNEELRIMFPYLHFANNDYGLFERALSGHISARKLLAAQTIIASNHGCDIIRAVVKDIEKIQHPNNSSSMRLRTDNGSEIYARKVLLCTGAFTPCRNLLPPGVDLDYQHKPLLVTLVEVSKEDALNLRNMPSICYYGDGADDWTTNTTKTGRESIEFYMLPPIMYPDGNYYVKMGYFSDMKFNGSRMAKKEIQDWFLNKGSDQVQTAELAKLITSVVKGITPLSFHPDSCILVETPTFLPYIGMIHSNLGIVLGDNGFSAKSSNEIGRVAAQLMTNEEWKYDIPSDAFKLIYRTYNSSKL